MIDELNPYPEYTDSGLPWLGEIPSHWEVRRNGRLFVQRNETGFPDLPILEVSLKTGVRVRDMENLARKQVMSDKEKYKRAKQGDIAYNMMRMWQGAVGVAPVDGLISPAYVVARPLPETDSRYSQYLFRTGAYMNEVNKFSRGIVSDRNRLYWEDFKQMPSPFPPPEEQAAIVRFLDHVDRRIRRYIRAKRQFIALLDEQKQAIIHRAVTRGLDPNVRFKPSNDTWFPQIPEHWKIVTLKRILERPLSNGLFKTKDKYGRGIPLVNVSDIYQHDYQIRPEQLDRVQVDGEETSSFSVHPGDVFFVRSSLKLEGTGRAAFVDEVPEPTVFECHLVRGRPSQSVVSPRYLCYLLNSWPICSSLVSRANTVTMSTLPQPALAATMLPIPTLSEQTDILAQIDCELATVNAALQRSNREINLMNEYRTRLIADVVTGKLDVQEAAARPRKEVDE